jgi:hypothetical protein
MGLGASEIHRVLLPGGRLVIVKDGGVPGAKEARRDFVSTVESAGVVVADQRELNAKGISFALWTCVEGDK